MILTLTFTGAEHCNEENNNTGFDFLLSPLSELLIEHPIPEFPAKENESDEKENQFPIENLPFNNEGGEDFKDGELSLAEFLLGLQNMMTASKYSKAKSVWYDYEPETPVEEPCAATAPIGDRYPSDSF